MTLDTKALEAAALDFCKHLCTPLEVKEIWANKHRKQIYLNATESVLSTYNTTRSQSLPDELKAIAEGHGRRENGAGVPLSQFEANLHYDIAKLLSHIQDIRRDTAREIVEMIEKRITALEEIARANPFASRESLGIATEFRAQAASIRTAYGVEG